MTEPTTEKWERHNAPNGEHIWQGDKHIADIVTDIADPGWDNNIKGIAEAAVLIHNDPKYKAAPDMYQWLKDFMTLMRAASVYPRFQDFQVAMDAKISEIPKILAKVEGTGEKR